MEVMASKRRLRNWSPAPGRAAVTAEAVADVPAKPLPRKDRKRWCRGKPGREHQPVIVFAPFVVRKVPSCEWEPSWTCEGLTWRCHHREECAACGRILRDHGALLPGECEAYPGCDGQKAAAEAERAEISARIAARPPRRKVITGQQSYRRRRENAQ
jgi:hypothetical protein